VGVGVFPDGERMAFHVGTTGSEGENGERQLTQEEHLATDPAWLPSRPKKLASLQGGVCGRASVPLGRVLPRSRPVVGDGWTAGRTPFSDDRVMCEPREDD
jgi:hypothetical protein